MEVSEAIPTPVVANELLEKKAGQAFWLGLLSIPLGVLPYVSFPAAIAGIYFGKKSKLSLRAGRAKAGVVFGYIGLLIAILSALFWTPLIYEMRGVSSNTLLLSQSEYYEVGKFGLYPPRDWQMEERKKNSDSEVLTFVAPQKEFLGRYTFAPSVVVVSSTPNDASASRMSKFSVSDRTKVLNVVRDNFIEHGLGNMSFTAQDIRIVTVNGREVIAFDRVGPAGEVNIAVRTIGIIVVDFENGQEFIVMATAPESRFADYEVVFNKVLQSFKLY